MKYLTKEFKQLQSQWYSKLAETGFEDQEDKHGNLPYLDTKSKIYKTWETTREFYLRLDSYLTHAKDLSPKDRIILEMYSAGVHLIDIANELKISRDGVHLIVKKYNKIIQNYDV